AAADHDDVLARGGGRGPGGACDVAVARVEVLEREVDAGQLAAGHGQVARDAGADREHHRVELLELRRRLDLDADAQLDALRLELGEAPLEHRLLELEVGDAEAKQASRGLVALEDDDV